MIVKYMRERRHKGIGKDPFLTLGKEYIVFGIHSRSTLYPNEISIQSDDIDGLPILSELKYYDIIDDRIPPNWSIKKYNVNDVEIVNIRPQEFFGDFWELYHDDDPEAIAIFKKVLRDLYHFHGWPADKVVW